VADLRAGAYMAGGFLTPDSGYTPRLRALGENGDGTVLVAVADDDAAGQRETGQSQPAAGKLLGTVMLMAWPQAGELINGPGEAEIRALAVAPQAQGSGVGKALLHAVLELAERCGVTHLVLATQRQMRAAHHLYEQAGFRRQPDRDWSPAPDV